MQVHTVQFLQFLPEITLGTLLILPYLWHFAGYNVNHRKRKSGTVGFQHRLTKEDAMKWFQQKYDGIILNTKK